MSLSLLKGSPRRSGGTCEGKAYVVPVTPSWFYECVLSLVKTDVSPLWALDDLLGVFVISHT